MVKSKSIFFGHRGNSFIILKAAQIGGQLLFAYLVKRAYMCPYCIFYWSSPTVLLGDIKEDFI
ncbi:hypothetical protein V7152_22475 [Neobacillus drentensis]|uniref:hypothetical protein n=1 Tax=Neobacillus drentensis TaxID=220684 RepID=UPI003000D05A